MTKPTVIFAVWEHDYERDALIGLFWRREDADAKAAENPPPPGSHWPDNRGFWTVEEHEIQGGKP